MERGTPQYTLGLPLFTPDNNQWNSLPTHIWYKYHDHSRSQGTVNKEAAFLGTVEQRYPKEACQTRGPPLVSLVSLKPHKTQGPLLWVCPDEPLFCYVPSPQELKVCKVYPWKYFLFLNFICARIQVRRNIKNPWSALGTEIQGPSLVPKPKVHLWYALLKNPRHPLGQLTP